MKTFFSALLTTSAVVTAFIVTSVGTFDTAYAHVTPSGGRTDKPIVQGTTITIGWEKQSDVPMVDLFLWNALTSERIAITRGVPTGQGSYQWNVPTNLANGSKYRFVVEPTNAPYRRIMSDSWVTVGLDNAYKESALDLPQLTNNLENLGRITLYPQPAHDVVRIRVMSDFNVMRVASLDGTTAIERTLDAGERTLDVNVQLLPTGMYTIVMTSTDGRCLSAPLQVISR
ncbi:MAG: Ser-Thr-rich GPI-anchored membrane family protein [bacterium]|nr:Ser-Thr-rich GPI-anchored membrane family protein [bacterium]